MNFFAKNTPRGSLERMMCAVPRLALCRGSGPGFQLPDGVEKPTCLDCTSYRAGRGCELAACPYLAERLTAGVISYPKLVRSALSCGRYSRLGGQITRLAARVGGFRFRSEPHRGRMVRWLDLAETRTNHRWLAAVYLLSARETLWERTEAALAPENIQWDRVTLGSLDPQSYALYKAAKGIWHGRLDIEPLELEDPDLIHDDTLMLIANAVLLAQYGQTMLETGDIN